MKKEDKTKIIDALVVDLNANNKIYLADCSSLTVEKINQFRRSCFERKISMQVVKNSLLKKSVGKSYRQPFSGINSNTERCYSSNVH